MARIVWPERMCARLAQLVEDDGMTYSDIAGMLRAEFRVRVTKNSCIGKARRLGLPTRPNKLREGTPTTTNGHPLWGIAREPRRSDGRLTLMQLRANNCRWPFGDKAPFIYCGRTTARGISYCPEHCARVYGTYRAKGMARAP